MYGLPLFFANSSLQRIVAEAPSENGQQSSNFNGEATTGDFKTSSTVIFLCTCAFGFKRPLSWFLTATFARSSSVVFGVFMYARAIGAISLGDDLPFRPSQAN